MIAAPTSQAYKACKQRYKQLVRLINEFRSSKIHWETNAILTSVVEIVSDNQVKILRGLQWLPKDAIGQSQLEMASNPLMDYSRQGWLEDRDRNGGLNIRRYAMGERPNICMWRLHDALPNPPLVGKVLGQQWAVL